MTTSAAYDSVILTDGLIFQLTFWIWAFCGIRWEVWAWRIASFVYAAPSCAGYAAAIANNPIRHKIDFIFLWTNDRFLCGEFYFRYASYYCCFLLLRKIRPFHQRINGWLVLSLRVQNYQFALRNVRYFHFRVLKTRQ